eukprot:jgi/Ulvmu1/5524/UM023_0060.1
MYHMTAVAARDLSLRFVSAPLVRPRKTVRRCTSATAKKEEQKFDGEYYKGLFSSSLDQRYTRNAPENSDMDMLSRNIKLGFYTVGFLAALVAAFLWSNGLF